MTKLIGENTCYNRCRVRLASERLNDLKDYQKNEVDDQVNQMVAPAFGERFLIGVYKLGNFLHLNNFENDIEKTKYSIITCNALVDDIDVEKLKFDKKGQLKWENLLNTSMQKKSSPKSKKKEILSTKKVVKLKKKKLEKLKKRKQELSREENALAEQLGNANLDHLYVDGSKQEVGFIKTARKIDLSGITAQTFALFDAAGKVRFYAGLASLPGVNFLLPEAVQLPFAVINSAQDTSVGKIFFGIGSVISGGRLIVTGGSNLIDKVAPSIKTKLGYTVASQEEQSSWKGTALQLGIGYLSVYSGAASINEGVQGVYNYWAGEPEAPKIAGYLSDAPTQVSSMGITITRDVFSQDGRGNGYPLGVPIAGNLPEGTNVALIGASIPFVAIGGALAVANPAGAAAVAAGVGVIAVTQYLTGGSSNIEATNLLGDGRETVQQVINPAIAPNSDLAGLTTTITGLFTTTLSFVIGFNKAIRRF